MAGFFSACCDAHGGFVLSIDPLRIKVDHLWNDEAVNMV